MIKVFEERFPLLIIGFSGTFGLDEVAGFERAVGGRLVAQERFGMAIHCSEMPMPKVAVLKRLADWTRAQSQYAQFMVGSALYLPSPLHRGAIGFLNRLAPPPAPQQMCSNWEEALGWVLERLALAGIDVPGVEESGQRLPMW